MSNYSSSSFSNNKQSSWNKSLELVEKNSTVLDIGCSSGNFGQALIEQKNCIVDGIDIDKQDLKKASKKLRKTYQLNVENDSIALSKKYDYIVMGDVIEHFAQPVKVLKKVKKLLKKDGKIIFSIPNITHMSVRLMLLGGRIIYGKTGLLDETHLHFYNEFELRRIFAAAGFKIPALQYVKKPIDHQVLTEELNRLGLKDNGKFENIEKSIDAVTYQFVGVAIVGVAEEVSIPVVSPVDLNDSYIKKWRDENNERYKSLEKKYHELKSSHEKLMNKRRMLRLRKK